MNGQCIILCSACYPNVALQSQRGLCGWFGKATLIRMCPCQPTRWPPSKKRPLSWQHFLSFFPCGPSLLTFVKGILVAILYQLGVDQQRSVQLMPCVCAYVSAAPPGQLIAGSLCGVAAPLRKLKQELTLLSVATSRGVG